MYCVEESKDQVQLVLQHFFFFASKRILQQFCWQEFSKTLRLLRRLDFSYWPWRWRFEGRVGRGSIFTIPCFPRYSARAILAKIIEKKKSLFQSTIYWGDSPSHLDLDRVVLSSQRILFYILGHANQTSLYKIAQVCTTYNRSKVWGPVGCNCQKFVLEVLDRLNLRFAPEAFIDRINQGDYDLTIADPEGLQPSSTASLNSMDSLRIIGTTCFHGQSTFYSLTTAYPQNELKITQEVMPVMQLPLRVLRYVPLTTGLRLIRSGGAAWKNFFALLRTD